MVVVCVVETRDSFDSSGSDSGGTFSSICDCIHVHVCAYMYTMKLLGVV